MDYRHIRVEPLSTHVGAEIAGVDLAVPVADETLGEIRRAFGEYGVVFFRDQHLTPEQHIAFAERFAQLLNREDVLFTHVCYTFLLTKCTVQDIATLTRRASEGPGASALACASG